MPARVRVRAAAEAVLRLRSTGRLFWAGLGLDFLVFSVFVVISSDPFAASPQTGIKTHHLRSLANKCAQVRGGAIHPFRTQRALAPGAPFPTTAFTRRGKLKR